jgi:hypothetical protein
MADVIIDDSVRKSFPGWDDEKIRQFYNATISAQEQVEVPRIYESDLSHARIIIELGWDAFLGYMRATTGTDELDDRDYVALAEAVSFLREIEKTSLYAAIYGAAAEASKKTISQRKKSYKDLTGHIGTMEIIKGI